MGFVCVYHCGVTQVKPENLSCHPLKHTSDCESVKKTVYMTDFGPPVCLCLCKLCSVLALLQVKDTKGGHLSTVPTSNYTSLSYSTRATQVIP